MNSADAHRAANRFADAVQVLQKARVRAVTSTEKMQLHCKLARTHNGAGEHYRLEGQLEKSALEFQSAETELTKALELAETNDTGLMSQKNVRLQHYFNANGKYKLNPEQNLEGLRTARQQCQEVLERSLACLEWPSGKARTSEDSAKMSALLFGKSQGVKDPEAGAAKATAALIKHELAFILENRPEGEEAILLPERVKQLKSAFEFYKSAEQNREGPLKAMTQSRLVGLLLKLGDVEQALSYLQTASRFYTQNTDGQRLDILETIIREFQCVENLSAQQKEAIVQIRSDVTNAQAQLDASAKPQVV
ncbi:MAG: hypothetical protein HC848_03220 [Limnobacter sp.]|nr:hypothetical protein [Limnobacter sp.]